MWKRHVICWRSLGSSGLEVGPCVFRLAAGTMDVKTREAAWAYSTFPATVAQVWSGQQAVCCGGDVWRWVERRGWRRGWLFEEVQLLGRPCGWRGGLVGPHRYGTGWLLLFREKQGQGPSWSPYCVWLEKAR